MLIEPPPGKGGNVGTYVMGVNDKDYVHDKHNVIRQCQLYPQLSGSGRKGAA